MNKNKTVMLAAKKIAFIDNAGNTLLLHEAMDYPALGETVTIYTNDDDQVDGRVIDINHCYRTTKASPVMRDLEITITLDTTVNTLMPEG